MADVAKMADPLNRAGNKRQQKEILPAVKLDRGNLATAALAACNGIVFEAIEMKKKAAGMICLKRICAMQTGICRIQPF